MVGKTDGQIDNWTDRQTETDKPETLAQADRYGVRPTSKDTN